MSGLNSNAADRSGLLVGAIMIIKTKSRLTMSVMVLLWSNQFPAINIPSRTDRIDNEPRPPRRVCIIVTHDFDMIFKYMYIIL